MKPKRTRLTGNTLYLLRKRRDWRRRAAAALHEFVTWTTGKPGREACEIEAIKAQDKVAKWYRPGRAELVLNTLHRRALAAFRNQFDS